MPDGAGVFTDPVPLEFSLTYDYRCPFARIAHDHVVTALRAGADWNVKFVPLSLGQLHVADGEPDIWDIPGADKGLYALQASVAVRELMPDRFVDVHHALFDARHRDGLRLADEPDIRKVLDSEGVDPEPVFAEMASGRPLALVRAGHEAAVSDFGVWGVPTFIREDRAVFVRLMSGPDRDAVAARSTVERVLHLMDDFVDLNEFKHTRIPR